MSQPHLGERLSEYMLGELDEKTTAELAAHVKACASCQAEVHTFSDELVAFAELGGEVVPSEAAAQRFDQALAHQSPFFSFVSALSKLANVADSVMQKLTDGLSDLANWEPGPAEHITIFHVDGGPATAGAVVGFVKVPAGKEFPEHTHQGRETVLIIQGTQYDSDGTRSTVGDTVVREAGTTHTIRAGDDEDLIFLVVVFDGVMVGDDLIGPDDPRI